MCSICVHVYQVTFVYQHALCTAYLCESPTGGYVTWISEYHIPSLIIFIS